MNSSSISSRTALALVALLLAGTTAASATTYYLTPDADTFVYQGDPNQNYGSDPFLLIRHTASGHGVFSFLRFEIPALDGPVISAKLRLRVYQTLDEVGYYHVSMGYPYWPESWLTWNNWQTGSAFTYLGSKWNVPAGTYLELDVANWVGASPVTFALASSADRFGQSFYSRNNMASAAYVPQLIITTEDPLPGCAPNGLTQGDPGDLLLELHCSMQGGNPSNPNWQSKLDPDFSEWSGGSQNKPVIAGAVALFQGPVVYSNDYRDWWIEFLSRQASSPGSTTGSGQSRFFKGTELFSNVYDAATTTGVMGAHYWALTHPSDPHASTIENLAKDYLRRTWFAWGLTASLPDYQRIYDVQGATRNLVETENRNCPVLAMASPRSKAYFGQDSKRWLLGKATGLATNCYKSPEIKPVVDYMVSNDSSVYGLNSGEISDLRALIQNNNIPSSVHSILGAIRLRTDFHFLLWSDGRRATYWIGSQLNGNIKVSGGKGTVHTAVYDRSTRDLELLFTLAKGVNTCLDEPARRIYVDDPNLAGCGSSHYITLPVTDPTYHYVLGPNGWRSCNNLACN